MIPSDNDTTVIGKTNFRNIQRTFGIKRRDRRQHTYIVGKTGVGKSTLLLSLIAQDINRGEGVAVIDPHGDLADKVLQLIPPRRINDVIHFDPSDTDCPLALNLLEVNRTSTNNFDLTKTLVASSLVSIMKKLWADSWGPRLEYLLRNSALALLDTPGSTLLGISRLFTDDNYRLKIVERVTDPLVKSFWEDEFTSYSPHLRSEALSPIQNKIGQFLSNAVIRNIVGQSRSSLDLRNVMDNRRILIANLAKGKIGEDCSALLGATLITKLQLAAMDRANAHESNRPDFYLYVDEFQNFATDSFAAILSEARKYRLNLQLAHQYVEQLPESLRAAIIGNIGTMILFRVGAADTEFLEREFSPEFIGSDLVRLDNFQAYIRTIVDGVACKPFSMATISDPEGISNSSVSEKLKLLSRQRYGVHKEVVESTINRWFGFSHGRE